jgi:hypothetical protein
VVKLTRERPKMIDFMIKERVLSVKSKRCYRPKRKFEVCKSGRRFVICPAGELTKWAASQGACTEKKKKELIKERKES